LGDKDDAAGIAEVFVIEKAPSSDGKVTDDGVAGLISAKMGGGVAPLADLVEVGSGKLAGDGADLRQASNGGLVAEGELIGAHAGVLVGECGDGAVHDHDHVVAELRQLLALAFTETFAEAHQDEQGTDTPCDTEHGEKAPQLVGHDGAEDLPESVRKAAHENETARGRVSILLYMNNTTKIRARFRESRDSRVRGWGFVPRGFGWTHRGVICVTEWNRDAPTCVVQASGLQRWLVTV